MPERGQVERFEFRILPGDPTAHSVPVPVLTAILKSAQDVVYLLALQVEGREVRERARKPQEIEARYALQCELPAPGSYVMPVTLGRADPSLLFPDPNLTRTADLFRQCGSSLSRRDADALRALVPDRQMRSRVLEGYRGLAPKPGDDWSLEVRDERSVFGTFDQTLAPFFQETRHRWAAEPEACVTTVTGRLNKIDFGNHVVSIIHPVTNKALQCSYVDECIEEMLYENRRDMIKVTGTVVLDDAGLPKEITDVQEIRDLDLSPFVVHRFTCGSTALRFPQPLSLTPTMDDSDQYLCLRDDHLGVDVFAMTRERLLADLLEQLALLWHEYAMATDDDLSAEALALKGALRDAVREGE